MRGLVPARARCSGWEHLARRDVTPPLPDLVSLVVPEAGPMPGNSPGPKGQVWGWTEALSEKSCDEAGASLGQKPLWEEAEPWCQQLEKDLVRGGGKDAGGAHTHTHTHIHTLAHTVLDGLVRLCRGKRWFPTDFSGPRRSWNVIQKVFSCSQWSKIDFLDPNSFEFPSW